MCKLNTNTMKIDIATVLFVTSLAVDKRSQKLTGKSYLIANADNDYVGKDQMYTGPP